MAVKIDGQKLNRLIRVPDNDSLIQEENGTWRGTCTFNCDWRLVFQLMPRRYQTRHPDFNNLICDRVTVSKRTPNVAVITAEFAGGQATDGSAGGDGNTENEPVIEVMATVSQQPIQTHPDFTDFLAGTPSAPLNSAIWIDPETNAITTSDTRGVFLKFADTDSMRGVEDYLMPQLIVRQTSIATTRPASVSVGIIDTPPVGSGSYLKTVHGYRRQGAVWVVEEEWLSAGDNRDWNPQVYST